MAGKEKNFMSAVVYLHNCETAAEVFLPQLWQLFEENFEHSEIICVNDCCTDSTADVVRKVVADAEKRGDSSVNLTLLNMGSFHGTELAMNAGVDLAIGDFVFEFDTTLKDYDINLVMDIYARCLQGFDIVSAVPQGKLRLSSKLFYKTFNIFSASKAQMTTERFRILSRRVLNRIAGMNITTPYRKAVYAESGLKTDAVTYTPTAKGKAQSSRLERSYRRYLATNSLILFTDIGYRLSLFMAIVMMALTALCAVYTVAVYLLGNPVAGWTTTLLFLCAAFFGLFSVLTVIVKYLQILVDLTFRRKRYSFESIEKLTK